MFATFPSPADSTSGSLGILGTGAYLPSRIVDNDTVGAPAGVDAEWIRRKTGINGRRWAPAEQATSDLAVRAGRAALADAGLDPRDLDLIVLATSTPDVPQPATASLVAHGLEVRAGTVAFDINAVCSGWVFALVASGSMLAGGIGDTALVVGGDVYSRILDPTDRRTVTLFGDGAGAVVVSRSAPRRTLLASRLASFGHAHELIKVPAGGSRVPASAQTLREGLHYFTMQGRAVRSFVEETVAPAIQEFLLDAGVTVDDIDHFIPHQANGPMVEELAHRVGIPMERTRTTVGSYGNTGSASVPITLAEAARSGHIEPGQLVLLAGFGGGMAMGLVLVRW